jgi:predicted nucleic acid-binding protein
MIVVSDTSPLCYLVLIDEAELLPKLFRQVVLPEAVVNELRHEDAPTAVRDWAGRLPSWIAVHANPAPLRTSIPSLHPGELSAILLAEALHADLVLLDDKAARRAATERGLKVTGTLGVLGEASTRGLTNIAMAIERLRTTNFRYSPAMLKAMLERYCQK